jgi:hypothetical protein
VNSLDLATTLCANWQNQQAPECYIAAAQATLLFGIAAGADPTKRLPAHLTHDFMVHGTHCMALALAHELPVGPERLAELITAAQEAHQLVAAERN